MTTVLGIDPGRTTGLVVRTGNDLDWFATAEGGWHAALDCIAEHQIAAMRIDAVAVEAVNKPSPHMGVISVDGLIDTALTAGAVSSWAVFEVIGLIWVPPAHNGQGHLLAYPEALRPTRGSGKGHDRLRHCRSAWDVAGTANLILRSKAPGPVREHQAGHSHPTHREEKPDGKRNPTLHLRQQGSPSGR